MTLCQTSVKKYLRFSHYCWRREAQILLAQVRPLTLYLRFQKGGNTKALRCINKQNGGKNTIKTHKHPLKSQATGRYRNFRLYYESDLKWFQGRSLKIIENEIDDDCQTDDEMMESGIDYVLTKLDEGLNLHINNARLSSN